MGEIWRPAVALGAAGVVGLWLAVAGSTRRRRLLDALGPVAEELGLVFHGDSFRGRVLGHAVRGDGVAKVPGREAWDWTALLAPFRFGERAVRLRVELTVPGLPSPDGPKALAAARRELKECAAGPGACEAALHGTEVVIVLRGEAAEPRLARRAVEKAIAAAGGA